MIEKIFHLLCSQGTSFCSFVPGPQETLAALIRRQSLSYGLRKFLIQRDLFIIRAKVSYLDTIKSSRVDVCDSTVHACVLHVTGSIIQYILYSTMF